MKQYYVVKEKFPTFILVEAINLKEAKIKAKELYPDEYIHYILRATQADIDFVKWIEETDAKKREATEGTDGGTTTE